MMAKQFTSFLFNSYIIILLFYICFSNAQESDPSINQESEQSLSSQFNNEAFSDPNFDFSNIYRQENYKNAWNRCYEEEKLFFEFLKAKSEDERDLYIFKGRKMIYSLENEFNPTQINEFIDIIHRIENESSNALSAVYCAAIIHHFKENCMNTIPKILQQRDYKVAMNLKRKVESMARGFRGKKRISSSKLYEHASKKEWDQFCNLWTDAWYDAGIYKMEDEEIYEGKEYILEYEGWKSSKLSESKKEDL